MNFKSDRQRRAVMAKFSRGSNVALISGGFDRSGVRSIPAAISKELGIPADKMAVVEANESGVPEIYVEIPDEETARGLSSVVSGLPYPSIYGIFMGEGSTIDDVVSDPVFEYMGGRRVSKAKFAKIPAGQLKAMAADISGKDGKSVFDEYKTKVPVIAYKTIPDAEYYKLNVPVEGKVKGPDYDEVVVGEDVDGSYPSDRMRASSYFMEDLAEGAFEAYKSSGGKRDAGDFLKIFPEAVRHVSSDKSLSGPGMTNGVVKYIKLFE